MPRLGRVLTTPAFLLMLSCASTPTPWEQGIATVTAEPLDSADQAQHFAHEIGSRLSAEGSFCLSNPAVLTLFQELFGGVMVTTVQAPDGGWQLTLSPPSDRKPSGAWGKHLELFCTLENGSSWNQTWPPPPSD